MIVAWLVTTSPSRAKAVTLQDVRAYVLVRQSALTSDDRKKIIMDNGGQLTYDTARRSMRLLGSKFFQDLQGGRNPQVKKTYDAYTMDEEETINQAAVEWETPELDEEQAFQLMADQGDEDATFILDFEDQIVETIQESPNLASCFVSYQEARARVRERARARGFWPIKGKGKSKGAKKGKGASMSSQQFGAGGGRRRSLADRIANSTCRIWKRECPQKAEANSKSEIINMTAEPFETDVIAIHEVVDRLPENVEKWQEHWEQTGLIAVRVHECLEISTGAMDCFGCEEASKFGDPSQNMEFSHNLHNRLVSCCRKHGIDVLAKCTTDSVPSPAPPTREQDQKVVMLDSPKGEDPAEVPG